MTDRFKAFFARLADRAIAGLRWHAERNAAMFGGELFPRRPRFICVHCRRTNRDGMPCRCLKPRRTKAPQ